MMLMLMLMLMLITDETQVQTVQLIYYMYALALAANAQLYHCFAGSNALALETHFIPITTNSVKTLFFNYPTATLYCTSKKAHSTNVI